MNIFLDLDGVLADFDGAFIKQFGIHPGEVPKKGRWSRINSVDNFFLNLPKMPYADELVQGTMFDRAWWSDLDVKILTACPSSNYHHVAEQKKAWVRQHYGNFELFVIPTNGSEAKPVFMQDPGDVLIDDWDKNIDAWNAAGGKGILYKNYLQASREKHDYLTQHYAGQAAA